MQDWVSNGLLNGRLLSSSAVLCTLPPSSSVGNITLEVSNNGVDFGSAFVLFQYLSDMYVSAVIPSSDTMWGGSKVTVVGQGFNERAVWCKFGLESAKANQSAECLDTLIRYGMTLILDLEKEKLNAASMTCLTVHLHARGLGLALESVLSLCVDFVSY